MNSSSIIFAFFIAGFLSVTVHDLFFGSIAYGPNNALHQVAKTYRKGSITSLPKGNALALKQPVGHEKSLLGKP